MQKKNLNLASQNFRLFALSKGMQNTRLNQLNPFFYDVIKSRDGVVMIVGVFEKQFDKQYAKNFQNC